MQTFREKAKVLTFILKVKDANLLAIAAQRLYYRRRRLSGTLPGWHSTFDGAHTARLFVALCKYRWHVHVDIMCVCVCVFVCVCVCERVFVCVWGCIYTMGF